MVERQSFTLAPRGRVDEMIIHGCARHETHLWDAEVLNECPIPFELVERDELVDDEEARELEGEDFEHPRTPWHGYAS